MTKCYSYKHLPKEATNYAGDQAPDREVKGVKYNYDEQIGCFEAKSSKDNFEEILQEKVADMWREVKHGERDDFDRGYLESLEIAGKFIPRK